MNDIHVSKTHFFSKPPAAGRLTKEMAVYDYLDKLGISYEGVDHDPADTIEACEAIVEALKVPVCKNLFLRNRQKTTFFLLLMPGDKKFETAKLSKQIGSARLSFAEPEYLEEFLNLTPGSVSVLGLMNDLDWNVDLLIDKDLKNDEYIGCHPCMNTSSLKIKTEDVLKKFLKKTGHMPRYVEL